MKNIGLIEKNKGLPVQVRASLWFLICSFLQRGISMITTPIFTRIMSTDDYGKFGVFNSWYGIISIIVALGLTGGIHTQGLIKYDKDRCAFSSSLQGLTLSLVSGWFVVYVLFRNSFNRLFALSTVQMISMFAIIWTTSVFGLWANEERVNYSYKRLVIITLLSSVFRPLIEIVLVLKCDDKASARIMGWAIAGGISFSWMFIIQMIKGRTYYSKRFWIYALRFNIPLVPHYLSQTVLNSADRIMIQRIIGDGASGIYNLAYSISLIMTLFNTALMQTLNPWIYQKIKDRKIKEISHVAYISLFFVAGVNLLLILLAPEVVAIFAPKSYHEAIYVIPPVAMSVFFMFMYDLYAKFAFYYEKTGAIMMASLLGALLNIILNYIFIGKYGYIAAGYTTLVCFITYALAHYLFMLKVCKECCESVYPYSTTMLLAITIVFLLLGFVFMGTYEWPIIRYGLFFLSVMMLILFRNRIIPVILKILDLKKA